MTVDKAILLYDAVDQLIFCHEWRNGNKIFEEAHNDNKVFDKLFFEITHIKSELITKL